MRYEPFHGNTSGLGYLSHPQEVLGTNQSMSATARRLICLLPIIVVREYRDWHASVVRPYFRLTYSNRENNTIALTFRLVTHENTQTTITSIF